MSGPYAITDNGFSPLEDKTEQFLFEDLKRAHRIWKDAQLAEAQAKQKRETAEKMFHTRVWRYIDHHRAESV